MLDKYNDFLLMYTIQNKNKRADFLKLIRKV